MAIPADPNDLSLLSSVFISADEEAYERARDVLEPLGLPNPEDGEFFSGMNADRIHLTANGIVMSFVYRRPTLGGMISNLFGRAAKPAAPVFEARTVVDDQILQPLFQLDLSPRCCLEIVPGVDHVGADTDTVRSIAQELKTKKIRLDEKREFVGVVRTPDHEEDLIVVANRRAIQVVANDAGSGDAGRQEKIYGALREQMQEAFKASSGAAMSKVMMECAKIVSLNASDPNRILNPYWKNASPDTERGRAIQQAARNYHRRLTQS
jgi:hypothetical protein